MTKDDLKNLKIPEIKNQFSDLLERNKDAFKTPNFGPLLVDNKEQTLVEIQKEISEIKKNNKNGFWKSLIISIISGIIGGIITTLFA